METRLLHVSEIAEWQVPSRRIKPELFVGKHECQLGKAVGLTQFGVNQLTLEPGAISALRHWHEGEDEFVYVLSGIAHHLANRSAEPATFIAVGTRKTGVEVVHYPDDDLGPATIVRDSRGRRIAAGDQ